MISYPHIRSISHKKSDKDTITRIRLAIIIDSKIRQIFLAKNSSSSIMRIFILFHWYQYSKASSVISRRYRCLDTSLMHGYYFLAEIESHTETSSSVISGSIFIEYITDFYSLESRSTILDDQLE